MQKIGYLFAIIALLSCCACKQKTTATAVAPKQETPMASVQFNADSAYQHVVRQCDFGPRTPGSEAHRSCGDYIVNAFAAYGLSVVEQKAPLTTWDGITYTCRNIIASHRPEAKERVMLCAHWDCRPWCDADKNEAMHRTPVMGANDGASGVAVMLELARQIDSICPHIGVDFICFDLEDYGTPYWAEDKAPVDGSDWCLGSQYWAAHPHRDGYIARYGMLLDMVGGTGAQFRYEGYSMQYASSVVTRIWEAARQCGYSNYFLPEDGGWATDDHVPVNQIMGIPTADIIPCHHDAESTFGSTWHTTNDTPKNISKQTLQAVGQTLVQLLINEK